MKFSDADAAEMEAKFTGDRATALGRTFDDATTFRSTNAEIDKTRKDLQAANERLNAEMAEWASLTAKEKEQNTAAQAALEAARVRATQLETRLTNLAVEHGVDPKALLEGTTVIPKKEEPKVEPIDTSRFVTADQFGALSAFNLQLPAKLQRIEREHFALTGEHLDTEAITAEIMTRAQKKDANIDPVAIWEGMHDIPAKRQTAAKKAHDEEIRQAEARGYDKARTEAALPGPQAPGRHAIVFNRPGVNGAKPEPRTSVLKRPAPESGVRSAAAALASHKYRPNQ
jgi:hypothetical protein